MTGGQYGPPMTGGQYGPPMTGGQYGPPMTGGQYGPPMTGGQYGPPQSAPAGPAEIGAYRSLLQACIQEKQLQAFYPPNSPIIEQIAQQAPGLINQVVQRWRVVKE
jgi:hypothetical protein